MWTRLHIAAKYPMMLLISLFEHVVYLQQKSNSDITSQMDKSSLWWSCRPSRWRSIFHLRWWKRSILPFLSSCNCGLPTGAFQRMRRTSGESLVIANILSAYAFKCLWWPLWLIRLTSELPECPLRFRVWQDAQFKFILLSVLADYTPVWPTAALMSSSVANSSIEWGLWKTLYR